MSASNAPKFDSSDFYERLGLEKGASAKEIKQAFRQLARDNHPDIAGEAPMAAERFKKIREAYETLSDPVRRRTYDLRGKRPGLDSFRWEPGRPQENQEHRQSYSDDLDLDDIFSDRLKGGVFRGRARQEEHPDFGFGASRPDSPAAGADICMRVEVPLDLAESGGSLTLEYPRLRRVDGLAKLEMYAEIFDLRLGPNTLHGDSVRIPKMGHAGANGGAYGDLICDIILKDVSNASERKSAASQATAFPKRVERKLRIGVAQALLGTKIVVQCPAGPVKLSIPACTSSGTRLRVAGKGELQADGARADHEVEIHIDCPANLDSESRALIERFAAINSTKEQDGHES